MGTGAKPPQDTSNTNFNVWRYREHGIYSQPTGLGAYLRRYGAEGVAKLVTLGSPHHGTEMARFGFGRNAQEMQPDSDWIRQLSKTEPPPVPTTSVWSARDNLVVPQDSSRLAGANEIVLPALGHLSMAFSPKILAILLRELPDPLDPRAPRDRQSAQK